MRKMGCVFNWTWFLRTALSSSNLVGGMAGAKPSDGYAVDPDAPLISGMSASVRMLESKLRNAELARRNIAMDTTIKVCAAMQPHRCLALDLIASMS